VLNTPFGRGLELGLGIEVADPTAEGRADTVPLGTVDMLAEGLPVPPQPANTGRPARTRLASARPDARSRRLLHVDIANPNRSHF
jgi:hypothetical protein